MIDYKIKTDLSERKNTLLNAWLTVELMDNGEEWQALNGIEACRAIAKLIREERPACLMRNAFFVRIFVKDNSQTDWFWAGYTIERGQKQ